MGQITDAERVRYKRSASFNLDEAASIEFSDETDESRSNLLKGQIEQAEAEKVAATIKSRFPVFKSITVVGADGKWNYHYVASNGDKEGQPQSDKDGLLIVSASDVKPPGSSRVGALPGQIGPGATKASDKARAFEVATRSDLEKATGLKAQRGKQDELTEPGRTSPAITTEKLLEQPKVSDPGLATDVGKKKQIHREPDFIATFKDEGGPGQVEVFEVTLDANFSIGSKGRGKGMGLSHKRTQIAATIDILAKRFPGVPIVYNIRSKEEPPKVVVKELENELRDARSRHSSQSIKMIWRFA